MTSPFGPIVLIAESDVVDSLPRVERALGALDLEHRVVVAEGPGDGARWARACLLSGERFLVAVGGEPLVHDVVNGMFENGRAIVASPLLGVVAAGTENEFSRQFGMPMDTERECIHLAGDGVYPIDVGRVTCSDPGGTERSEYFVNIAEVGMGADMASRAEVLSRRVGRGRHFVAFWSALLRAPRARVHVEAARQTYEGEAYQVVVGNGRFGVGGFRVSPRSFPGDGILEVLVHHGPKSHAFTSLPKSHRGEQVPSPNIAELRGNRVRVKAEPRLRVAVDGRAIGWTPVSFEVLPRAVRLKV